MISLKIDFTVNWVYMVNEFNRDITSNNRIPTLILLFSQVNTKYHMGRLLACIRFAEELKLTEREWALLLNYLFKELCYLCRQLLNYENKLSTVEKVLIVLTKETSDLKTKDPIHCPKYF